MTDHPRFEPVSCRPDEAHRRYHGARLVDRVFGIADHRALQRPTGPAPHTLKFEVGVPITLVLLLIGALAGLNAAHSQRSPQPASDATAAVGTVGRDSSPDEDIGANWRRPQASRVRAPYTP